MLTPILITLAVVVILFVVIVSLRPNTFRVTRSATMAALPADIFPHVNDFHKWDAWSPWASIDPGMRQTHEGEPAGEGSIYAWDGNAKVGSGRQTITESRPHELIRIRLEFFRPFRGTNEVEFLFEPVGEETKVTWDMLCSTTFMSKAFGLFMNMDKMIGKDFEKGLARLKTVVESQVSDLA